MGLKRLLGHMLTLSALIVVAKCQCDSFSDVVASGGDIMGGIDIVVNVTGTPCVRCLADDGQPRIDTTYTLQSPDVTAPDLVVMDGVLRILNTSLVPSGVTPRIAFFCQSTTATAFIFIDWFIVSNNLVPPTTVPLSLTVPEFAPLSTVTCNNANSVALGTVLVWRNPQMEQAAEQVSRLIIINDINRNQAGNYVCVLTANTGQTASVTVPVVVQYPPEATTQETPSRNISLGGTLTLRCDFGGVPTPSVAWVLNSTVELNDSDSRITITTNEDSAVLNFTGLGRDDGGLYTCSFENSVGVLGVNVTTVLVWIPPAPVTDLQNTTFEKTLITVTWVNGFDGFTPITGATIQYTAEGGSTMNRTVSSMDPTTLTLSDLMPFTNYTISVSLLNIVGTGDSTSIQVQTKSLQLTAPLNVMITVVSSTVLQIDWNAPAESAGTDLPSGWFVDIMPPEGGNPVDDQTIPAQTTTATFSSLSKGTQYSVTVRGQNEVGPGVFSEPVTMETAVDPPTPPQNVVVEGATSSALKVTWDPPMDDGGREILDYIITVEDFTQTVAASDERLLLIREDFLVNSTTYSVSVSARNNNSPQPLTGPPATELGRTLSLDEPQAIIDDPVTSNVLNTSITLSWEDPGGEVDRYIIRYTLNRPPNPSMDRPVDGDTTSFTLTGLEPMTSYTVVVFSMNSNGTSIASPPAMFVTLDPLPPRVTASPTGEVFVGTTVVLNCISSDTRDIIWSERSNIPLVPPVFQIDGVTNNSTLTINNIQLNHSGVYVCEVRQEMSSINVVVMVPVVTPTDAPTISNTVIIAASAGGGGALLILICLIGLLLCCICCRRNKEKDNKYITNRAPLSHSAMKPDKRTKDLFEVSTNASYAPVRSPGAADETGVSFNMPEDYQAHSSFNTMDKVDKPKAQERSASPETANTSSFGVGAPSSTENLTAHSSSPPRYQDMPPANYDGTLL